MSITKKLTYAPLPGWGSLFRSALKKNLIELIFLTLGLEGYLKSHIGFLDPLFLYIQ